MKYVVDDKKLNAATFIAFVNQVWQGSYDVEKTQGALSKTINSSSKTITVNSSPYAVPVYHKLGFIDTDTEQLSDGIRYIPMKFEK